MLEDIRRRFGMHPLPAADAMWGHCAIATGAGKHALLGRWRHDLFS